MIQLGQKAPDFTCKALAGTEFREVRLADYRGRWLCLYFYPMDFTFVCPTEVRAFSDAAPEFRERNCEVLGGSCDSEFTHLGWVMAKSELRDLKHPLFSDYTKAISASMGVLDHASGAAQRALFLIDPAGVVRFITVTEQSVVRNPEEVLRVLDALQADPEGAWSKKAST